MATWADWFPNVTPDVPNCPSPLIEQAVRETAIDFLEQTHFIQRTSAPIDIAGGAAARSFAAPLIAAGEIVLAVKKAWILGEPADIRAPSEVEDDWPDWKTRTGDPECLVLERDDAYWVVPAPVALMSAALRLRVAVGLAETATQCDDLLRVRWRDAITFGAKARLMYMADKPWTAPDRAATFQGMYLDEVASAAVRALRAPARKPLVTKPHWF